MQDKLKTLQDKLKILQDSFKKSIWLIHIFMILILPKYQNMIKQLNVLGLTIISLLFLLPSSYGQEVPNNFTYQAIARNLDGSIISNQTVNVEIRITNEAGVVAYSEIRQVTTNNQGRIALFVGEGDPTTFRQINWGESPHSLVVFVDGTLITNAPFSSVPYAFAANTALDDGDKDATNELQNLIYDAESGLLSLSNSTAPAIPLARDGAGAAGDSFWQSLGSSGIYYNQGSVELKGKDGSASSPPIVELIPLQDSSGTRGAIFTYGNNGNSNVSLSNISGLPNNGSISIGGSEGISGVLLYTNSNDDGEIRVRDKNARSKVYQFVNNEETGTLVTYGENGNSNVSLSNLIEKPNNGAINVQNSEGNSSVFLYANDNDNGEIRVRNKDGISKVQLLANTEEAGGLVAYGENGNENVAISNLEGSPNNGSIDIKGSESNTGILLYTDSENDGRLLLNNKDGNNKVDLFVADNQSGGIATKGEDGSPNVLIGSFADTPNSGLVSVRGSEGNTGVLLSTNNDDGRISLRNKVDITLVDLFIGNSGAGAMIIDGPNNNSNIVLGNLADHPNNGFISLRDESGDRKAGIYVNAEGQGIVFADEIIDFTQDPSNENNLISYSVLEGPEVAAYDRGTFELSNGEAFVPYAEHLKIVANTEKVTIQITPLEWDTYGVAVTRKTAAGFYVKELKGGAGNFQFDWEVKAVRKGQEEYRVFRSKAEVAKIVSPEVLNATQRKMPVSQKTALSKEPKQFITKEPKQFITKEPKQFISETPKQE